MPHASLRSHLRCTMGFSLLSLAACAAVAQPTPHESPIHLDLGFERVRLPGRESMGLVGGSVLFPLGHSWWAGLGVYGAATGQRGGLFVGGAEVQRIWDLPWGFDLRTGLYAGGGGGAAAPVGGGLMLRGAATLTHAIGPLRAGLSWSHVRFPSGDIGSAQVGVLLSWERPFRSFDAGDAGRAQPPSPATGLGLQRLAGTAGTYRLRGNDTRRIGLVGARGEWRENALGFFSGIEASAAASGGAAGYMEILGDVGWRWTPWPDGWPLALEARAALGLGGGGAVPTEGGRIGKWALGLSTPLGNGWRAGADVGELRGLGSELRGRTAQVWFAMDLEPTGDAAGTLTRNEWTVVLQRYLRAHRNDGTSGSLDTVGVKLNRFVGEHAYLSGQAHSAYGGGAGAYGTGLIGGGLASAPAPLRFGAELLVGASGGGGVASGGGAIGQALAWAGWSSSAHSQWRVGLGGVKSLRGGELRSGIVELSWTYALGLGGR